MKDIDKLIMSLLVCLMGTAAYAADESLYRAKSTSIYEGVWGDVEFSNDDWQAVNIEFQGDGKVIINNIWPDLGFNNQLEGVLEDSGTISIPLPQCIGEEIDFFTGQPTGEKVYAYSMDYIQDDFDSWYEAEEDPVNLIFRISEDGVVTMDEDMVIGVFDEFQEWMGFGKSDFILTPFTTQPVTLPSEIATVDYAFFSNSFESLGGCFAKVAIDGEDIYVLDFSDYYPGAVLKGTIKGSEVVFPKQFIGVGQGYLLYALPGTIKGIDISMYTVDFRPGNELKGEFDETSGQILFSDKAGLSINIGESDYRTCVTYWDLRMASQPELSTMIPATPTNLVVNTYEDYGSMDWRVAFNLKAFNQDGQLLDPDKVFWRFYVDDQPYTFNPGDYGFQSSRELIPLGFSNFYTIFYFGDEGLTAFRYVDRTGDKIGIQSVYKDTDEEEYCSPIVSVDLRSSSVEINEVEDILERSFFDISGTLISQPQKGLFIERTINKDGAVKYTKRLNK